MAGYASEMKGAAIHVLHEKPLVYWTRFFVIVTAFSRPQIEAILYPIVVHADFAVLAAGDVVVHIFLAPERAFYNLEEFYANAQEVPLPFESREQ
eukprot:SM000204S05848  [mRNA]  locus=s204:62:485:- [translate_table: standard]